MRGRRVAAIAAAAARRGSGQRRGVAATRPTTAEGARAAILDDAAGRLGVAPGKLRDALGDAEDAQLDAAVKRGELTQEQADAVKQRRADAGLVLGGPGGGFGEHRRGPGFGPPGGPGRGGPGDLMDAAAAAIGITEAKLFEELRSGKSLSDVAKAHGKTFDDVKTAVTAAVKKKLDAAVKRGDLTRSQADDMLSHLTEHFDGVGRFGRHRP